MDFCDDDFEEEFDRSDVTRCPNCGVTDAEDCEPGCRCEHCADRDPDGEAFRGTEAAAYEADQQTESWGLK